MSEDNILFHKLQREIQARKEAEKISEKKMADLYLLNKQLEDALANQKKITHELKIQTSKTEDERHAKSTLQSILESAIEYSIVAINLEGIILVWNKGAQRNYGYKPDEMVKKQNILILHTPEDVQSGRVQELLDHTYHAGNAEGVFVRVRKDNSRFTASVNFSLRRDEMGTPVGYVMISKDVTESKLIEEQLRKSNRELEQFAYVASHDLKAPLRAIERLSSWIEEDNLDKLDEKSKENLALLRSRTKRMSNLIDGILQYSRAGRVDADIFLVDTKELIHEVIDSLNPEKKFSIVCDDNLPVLQAAKIPMSQVFANIISNSIKHHHNKTGIIRVGVEEQARFYKFLISDDGPGIEPEYFDKIFVIFQTLKSRDELEATGIGLSIVKKIVEWQGGVIAVESTVGKGTTFSFTWPKQPLAASQT